MSKGEPAAKMLLYRGVWEPQCTKQPLIGLTVENTV